MSNSEFVYELGTTEEFMEWPTIYEYDEFPNCPKCGARALLPEVEEIPEVWVSTCKSCNRVTTFSQGSLDQNEPEEMREP